MQRSKKKSLELTTATLRNLQHSELTTVGGGYQEYTDIPYVCQNRTLGDCRKYV
jgi:hypothetical protein